MGDESHHLKVADNEDISSKGPIVKDRIRELFNIYNDKLHSKMGHRYLALFRLHSHISAILLTQKNATLEQWLEECCPSITATQDLETLCKRVFAFVNSLKDRRL